MATNRRDVLFVVRAKDEAAKAFATVAEEINALIQANLGVGSSVDRVESGLQRLLGAAVNLDKAYVKISGAADTAAAAFARQEGAIAGQRAELAALKAQAEATQRATRAIEIKIVDAGLQGDIDAQARFRDQLQATESEQRRLDTSIAKVTASIVTNEAALDGQRSKLQEVGSLANAAAAAQARLAQETDRLAAGQRELQRAAAVLPIVELATGVTRDRSELDDLARQLRAQSDAHDELIAKLRTEQNIISENLALEEARRRAATLLPGNAVTGKSAKESFAVFDAADLAQQRALDQTFKDAAANAEAQAEAAAKLRAQIDPLGEIQARLNVELAEANALYKAGKISATELAQATALLKTNADRAAESIGRRGVGSTKPLLFGLKPFEVQNLGFQINDIVTQLASGTSLTQTLAQQGGQILQIFPQAGAVIVRALSNPAILAASASMGVLIAALRAAAKEEATIRGFEGALAATGDAAAYQAAALADSAREVDRFGVSAKDAVSVIRTFVREGVNPDRITEFGLAAKNMADVLGISVTDAAQKLSDAFTGNYEAINRLDRQYNFLTATERDHIRVLFEEGKAHEGRAQAFAIFARRYDEGARKMRGEWTEATRSLSNAWESFTHLLGDTSLIRGTISALDDLGKSVTSVLNRLGDRTTLDDLNNDIERFYGRIGDLNANIGAFGDPLGLKQLQIDEYKAKIDALIAERQKLEAARNPAAGGDTAGQDTQRQLKATQDLRRETTELAEKNKDLSAAQRIAAAEKRAGAEADRLLADDSRRSADEASQAEFRRQKIAEARREVEKEITREKEAQRRKDEQAIRQFAQKVPGVESGGRNNARPTNPDGSLRSSALGQGQFVESTWLALFRKYFPEEVARLGEAGVLELRRDATTTKKLIEIYARENAEVLQKAGLSVSQANLYLAHFLGPTGAVKVLKAAGSAPTSSLLTADAINANPEVLRGKTAAQVRAFAGRKFGDDEGDASRPDADLTARIAEIELQRLEIQARFDERIKQENDERRAGIAAMTSQQGLQDEALIAEERKQAIVEAVLRAQQEVDRINADRREKGLPGEIAFTQAQREEVERLTGAYFDLQNAKAKAQAQTDSATRELDDLTALRDALRQQIELMREAGDREGARRLVPRLEEVNGKLSTAIDRAIAFYRALDLSNDPLNRTREQIEAIIVELETAKTQSKEWGEVLGVSARSIADAMANSIVNSIDTFLEKVAKGKNVIKSFFDAFRQGAADFLRLIAKMILQQLALNAAKAILGGLGIPVGTNHTGGIVGRDRTSTRTVSPAWFMSALRYHAGGIAGLKPNEVPAILERGEEVLTRNDPRHRANGGGGGGGGADRFRIVNVLDAGDLLQKALSTRAGEEAIINYIRSNQGAVNGALSG